MLTSGVVLIYENVRSHRDNTTQWLLEQFQWDIFDYQLYSPETEEMARKAGSASKLTTTFKTMSRLIVIH